MKIHPLFLIGLGIGQAFTGSVAAGVSPLELTPDSYNADMIVEKSGPRPLAAGVTATMDNALTPAGYVWYEVGYNAADTTTGIPAHGLVFEHQADVASAVALKRSYLMPPSYEVPNALFLSAAAGTASGTFTLTTPAAYETLSFLSGSGGGACAGNYLVEYVDGSTATGPFSSPDWFGGVAAEQAWLSKGRVSVDLATSFHSVTSTTVPRLLSASITGLNPAKLVKSVTFTRTSGGRCSIFAISGQLSSTDPWVPLPVTGFTHDVVMAVGDPTPVVTTTGIPFTMDVGEVTAGTAAPGNTWFERGYVPMAPNSGLPAPGSTITVGDNSYRLAPDYTANNVVHLDATHTTATVTLNTPQNFSVISLLNAAAYGPITVDCRIHFQGGATEDHQFVCKDWFNNTPVAYNAAGRVSLNNMSINGHTATLNPRLYETEIALTDKASAIERLELTYPITGTTGRVAIFAVSGALGPVKPIFSVHPVGLKQLTEGDYSLVATISGGDLPMTTKWQKNVGGTFIDVVDGAGISGSDTASLRFNPAAVEHAGVYRLAATNAAGQTNSLTATVNLISTLPDVTRPGDPISVIRGGSNGAEAVASLIDGKVQKHYNAGVAPLSAANPTGLIVTPSVGASTVLGMRLYTANDVDARDPADYILEGSTDGTTWTQISAGPLALPTARNTVAVTTDIAPMTHNMQQVMFGSNTVKYTSYRLSFTSLRNASDPLASGPQLAELELLGTYEGSAAQLTIEYIKQGSDIIIRITSNAAGDLEESTTLGGSDPWNFSTTMQPGVPIDYIKSDSDPRRFFRLVPTP